MKGEPRYLQFPLFLIREMFVNKEETINKILHYGIYKYSTKFSYNLNDATKSLMYYYYRKRSDLTSYLEKTTETYIEDGILVLDEDYNGFRGKEFEPEFETEQLTTIFKTDIEFRNRTIEFHQMQLSYNSLGISGNIEHCLKKGKEIERQTPEHEPIPMINKSILFNFRDNAKSEFEIAQFLAFIAVKSIVGTKQYVKTNKQHIVSRMFGYTSIKHLPSKMNKTTSELFNKYSIRYHIDKVIQSLELETWNVQTYSHNMRGMYVAIKNKITLDELAKIAETKKQKNKISALKKAKAEATEKALKQLNWNK